MTRIAHISSAIPWRGAEQQIHWLLNADRDGLENYLFCPKGAAIIERNLQQQNKIGTYKKIFGLDISGGMELRNFLLEKRIGLVHVHDSHALNLYWTAYLLGVKIPAVYHKHHDHPIKNSWKYDRDAIRKIICVSQAVAYTAALSVDKSKIRVIYSGLKIAEAMSNTNALRKEFHIPENANVLGMVCALEKEKNVFELIEIARLYKTIYTEPLFFILAGSGSYKDQIRSAIQQANQEKTFIMLGFQENIPQVLAQLDIFLFTSSSEGFPLSVLEAMQAGVPVVSRDSGGIKEIIQHQNTGLIYRDVKHACEQINWLIQHQPEKRLLVQNAQNFVREFSVENMIQKTHTLYKEILP